MQFPATCGAYVELIAAATRGISAWVFNGGRGLGGSGGGGPWGGSGGGGAGGEAVPPRSDGQEAEQLERALLETIIPSGPLAAGVRVGFEAPRAGERLGRFDGDGREGMCTVGELERRARWMRAYAADMRVYYERGFSEPEARAAPCTHTRRRVCGVCGSGFVLLRSANK